MNCSLCGHAWACHVYYDDYLERYVITNTCDHWTGCSCTGYNSLATTTAEIVVLK